MSNLAADLIAQVLLAPEPAEAIAALTDAQLGRIRGAIEAASDQAPVAAVLDALLTLEEADRYRTLVLAAAQQL